MADREPHGQIEGIGHRWPPASGERPIHLADPTLPGWTPMMTTLAYDPLRVTGFTQDRLARVFDRLVDPRDWQAPIQAEIPAADRWVVQKAVLWFTDTVPTFSPAPGRPDHLLVTALGYRLGPSGVGPATVGPLANRLAGSSAG